MYHAGFPALAYKKFHDFPGTHNVYLGLGFCPAMLNYRKQQ